MVSITGLENDEIDEIIGYVRSEQERQGFEQSPSSDLNMLRDRCVVTPRSAWFQRVSVTRCRRRSTGWGSGHHGCCCLVSLSIA